MPTIPSLLDMLKAGVHFGHRTSRWHPKMEPYIYGVREGIHVIDIEKTKQMLDHTLTFVEELTARGGTLMFIGTKPQLQDMVEKYAQDADVPYVNERWLGGTFTNFSQIEKLIKNYKDLRDKREKGELKKYTKLEQLQFDRKIEELEEKIGGISKIDALPEAVFVLDVRNDKTAVMEARKKGVKVIAICDTNVNPDLVDYVIPANDDSVESVKMITRLVAEAVKLGKARAKTRAQRKAAGDDIKVKKDDTETVNELDDEVNEQLAREKAKTKT